MQGCLVRGRYRARFAESEADLAAAQALRSLCFTPKSGIDADAYDGLCQHVLVEEAASGRLVCCFRLMPLANGAEIDQSYSAQFYELSALRGYAGRMVEMGRFCIHPEAADPDILRVAWGAMTKFVDDTGVEMLFGCSSFVGVDSDAYLDAFTLLGARHIAPRRWLPRVKAPRVFRFAERLRARKCDRKLAMRRMPPLLKTYLAMGGWVSDHAVVDSHMNTLHVFTGLEIGMIPPARARLLRAV